MEDLPAERWGAEREMQPGEDENQEEVRAAGWVGGSWGHEC